jgi:hypothetical protein
MSVNKNYNHTRTNQKEVSIGLHAYSARERARWIKYDNEIIIRCIIPKGAYYYYNQSAKQYVTNTMITPDKFIAQ